MLFECQFKLVLMFRFNTKNDGTYILIIKLNDNYHFLKC